MVMAISLSWDKRYINFNLSVTLVIITVVSSLLSNGAKSVYDHSAPVAPERDDEIDVVHNIFFVLFGPAAYTNIIRVY